jgi:histidine triad (HIT) family protein
MAEKSIFKKIIDKEIPADIVFEDDVCIAFHDTSPQAPVHVLVIPKKEITNVAALSSEDTLLAGQLITACQQVAKSLKLDNGFRIVVNCGPDGGQSVDHLHFHVLGGRTMKWPPG